MSKLQTPDSPQNQALSNSSPLLTHLLIEARVEVKGDVSVSAQQVDVEALGLN